MSYSHFHSYNRLNILLCTFVLAPMHLLLTVWIRKSPISSSRITIAIFSYYHCDPMVDHIMERAPLTTFSISLLSMYCTPYTLYLRLCKFNQINIHYTLGQVLIIIL
uniref:Uncharacterized protein n=1 Tax=Cacopsylla melanoneura TaxID=428564 RepID=A0A8D8TIX7_9HEMI